MTGDKMKFGDFSLLAEKYSKYRPGYSTFVRDAFLGLLDSKNLKGADVGAGTGIWTRMLAERQVDMIAVEPNSEMRKFGKLQNGSLNIKWVEGSAENTTLADSSVDFVSMASSFHWTNFDLAVSEFSRILKTNGLFICLWNPRKTNDNEFLMDIESELNRLKPNIQRKSSGNSTFCNELFFRLKNCNCFSDVIYLEAEHTEVQNPETYVGLWESVNDIRVQLGEDKFAKFIDYVKLKVASVDHIDAKYTTRAWIARKK